MFRSNDDALIDELGRAGEKPICSKSFTSTIRYRGLFGYFAEAHDFSIKDTFTDVSSARTTADLLEDLFAGRLELIGEGKEGQVLRDTLAQTRVSDLTLLDDGDSLKVEALRRLHYVQAVFDERPRVRTRETLSPIIERVSGQSDYYAFHPTCASK